MNDLLVFTFTFAGLLAACAALIGLMVLAVATRFWIEDLLAARRVRARLAEDREVARLDAMWELHYPARRGLW